jgi:hypothetical protein
VGAKHVHLVRLVDSVTRDWLDSADVVSEGRVELEGNAERYFGTTSILIGADQGAGLTPAALYDLVEGDPHLRLRVVRLARREAVVRAIRPLGTIAIELTFAPTRDGVAIGIDVSAIVVAPKRASAL